MKLVLYLTFLWFLMQTTTHAGPRDAQWQSVEEAMKAGQPKTALERLAPILEQARADRAWPELAKATLRQIALEGVIQGNRPEERITRLEARLPDAPPEIQPILQTALALWYWDYFQQNRWRFVRRTATREAPGADFTTWDLARLFAEIDRQFSRALAAAPTLQAVPVATYDDLLQPGTVPDTYRPTLYDFVAHEALAFYTSGEQAGALPQDAFVVSSDSDVFAPAEKFLVWEPATTDTQSPAYRAIRLYQDLLRFHRNDADRSAWLDADLARLVWASNTAAGEDRTPRYLQALETFVSACGEHPLASLGLHHWAVALHAEGRWAEAHRLARRGQQIHPESPGGQRCAQLVAEIEAPSASLAIERIWNRPWPAIQIAYRNLDHVSFRLVPADWDEGIRAGTLGDRNYDEKKRDQLLRAEAAYAWTQVLPPTPDFKSRTQQVSVPTDLKPGYYFLLASHDPAFALENNQLSIADLWVSDLALVSRPRNGVLEGFVLEAGSGEPISGARVQAWYRNARGQLVPWPDATTDTNGCFEFPAPPTGANPACYLKAGYGGQKVATADWQYVQDRPRRPQATEQTVFFTDRALYRPGQTIQYKGICLRSDPNTDTYQTLSSRARELTVQFLDANGKEISRRAHRLNDYGAFSGSFTAPRDRLAGRMRLAVREGPRGSTFVQVEEYKRPKFQVTLNAPTTATRLGQKVRLTGQALAYTGAPIDAAAIQYRVTREARLPWWREAFRFGHGIWPFGESQEIAHGSLTTDAEGRFEIDFVAQPDRKIPVDDDPIFSFQVHVDVTDTAGETRSQDRSVPLGYKALEARLTTSDWLTTAKPVEIEIATTSLDGQPRSAEGVLRLHALIPPATVQRPPLLRDEPEPGPIPLAGAEADPDLSEPDAWPLGQVLLEQGFTTDAQGHAVVLTKTPLAPGAYRAVLEATDPQGQTIKAMLGLIVLEPQAPQLALKVPHLLAAPRWSAEPEQEFLALWGTGYDAGRAFLEIEHRGKLIRRGWTAPGRTQAEVKLAVTEAHRGGFTLHVTQVRDNRAYLESRRVEVPWTSRQLTVKWETFRSKLAPGSNETWTAVISGPNAQPAVAEMVASLSDASLDALLPRSWPAGFSVFRQDFSTAQPDYVNDAVTLAILHQSWAHPALDRDLVPNSIQYRSFPPDLRLSGHYALNMMMRYGLRAASRGGVEAEAMSLASPQVAAPALAMADAPPGAQPAAKAFTPIPARGGAEPATSSTPTQSPTTPDLSQVSARRNLEETAFFFPHLTSDTNGVVRMTFTLPEALTEWRFLGFAHDRGLRAGLLEDRAVTSKELMVQPNPPRFLREGDVFEFTVKVSNRSDQPQPGRIQLTFRDPISEAPLDAQLANIKPQQDFEVPARQSRTFSWRLQVPDTLTAVAFKTVGATATVSDGEEGLLPVLGRRILVTESLPLPIRGPSTREFQFDRLLRSGQSESLRHQSLTIQMVSHPAWYAVLALPYLMEYPHQCTEQTFNRLYANTLARHLANSDPRIRRVFDLWKNTATLDSPLEKNADLKSILLEESPWVRQAASESEARKNLGILFDANRLTAETDRLLNQLREAQRPDGAWPWFPGGPANDYMTLYITTGFGRLRHLGCALPIDTALRALNHLDAWLQETHQRILRDPGPEKNHLSPTIALYLYGRSFFLKEKPITSPTQNALDYFLGQARQYWLKLEDRQSQAHLALALQRFRDTATADLILQSLWERSVTDDELGRFWRDTERSWWWFRAPIESQALMIEAFTELGQNPTAAEECKVWLLKQKQTQDWKTTKATADAVYALLLRGTNFLSSDRLVEVSAGGINLTPGPTSTAQAPSAATGESRPPAASPEPGTGFYEHRFVGADVKPALGQITVKKLEPGVAWGSAHWQYLEDVARITPYAGTPLQLKKTLFTRKNTDQGPVLDAVQGPLRVGDELVVRIELRVDRDLEYVHLKDQRGSGTEPVNVLSGYRYQDGLAYYESTRDAASHFFIDYLPKGTYVFEYATRVQHRGRYQTGIATIQCMYAPEFNSHSASLLLEVQ